MDVSFKSVKFYKGKNFNYVYLFYTERERVTDKYPSLQGKHLQNNMATVQTL